MMECMCAQTRPQSLLSSKKTLGGIESEPMLTPRGKIPASSMTRPGQSSVAKAGFEPTSVALKADALLLGHLCEFKPLPTKLTFHQRQG